MERGAKNKRPKDLVVLWVHIFGVITCYFLQSDRLKSTSIHFPSLGAKVFEGCAPG